MPKQITRSKKATIVVLAAIVILLIAAYFSAVSTRDQKLSNTTGADTHDSDSNADQDIRLSDVGDETPPSTPTPGT